MAQYAHTLGLNKAVGTSSGSNPGSNPGSNSGNSIVTSGGTGRRLVN